MKKAATLLISAILLTSIFNCFVSAQEIMSYEQIQSINDDFDKNYSGKTYTTDDWIYYPTLFAYYSDTEVNESGNPATIDLKIAFEITKYRNKNATSVTIPGSIDGNQICSIHHLAFKENLNLEKVTFSNGIEFLGFSVLNNHKKLKEVILPTSIKSIGWQAFSNCKNLKAVTLPTNIDIHQRAFKNCKNLKTLNYIGISDLNRESYIYKESFANCVKLKNINLGKAWFIGYKAFYNCKSLRSVSIPRNAKVVYNRAFENCKSLSKVTFKNKYSNKFSEIGKNTFKNTKKGIKFVVKNKKVAKQLKKRLKNSGVKNAKILIGKKVVYKNING